MRFLARLSEVFIDERPAGPCADGMVLGAREPVLGGDGARGWVGERGDAHGSGGQMGSRGGGASSLTGRRDSRPPTGATSMKGPGCRGGSPTPWPSSGEALPKRRRSDAGTELRAIVDKSPSRLISGSPTRRRTSEGIYLYRFVDKETQDAKFRMNCATGSTSRLMKTVPPNSRSIRRMTIP